MIREQERFPSGVLPLCVYSASSRSMKPDTKAGHGWRGEVGVRPGWGGRGWGRGRQRVPRQAAGGGSALTCLQGPVLPTAAVPAMPIGGSYWHSPIADRPIGALLQAIPVGVHLQASRTATGTNKYMWPIGCRLQDFAS